MGASGSSQSRQVKQPEDIVEFRQLTGPADFFVIPEVPGKRRVTDFKFTVVFGVCLLLLVPFLIYSFVQSDLNRFVHGYDKCGNVCGENNTRVAGIQCSGKDNSKKPLLLYEVEKSRDEYDTRPDVTFRCVESCDPSDYIIVMNRCFKDSDQDARDALAEISGDLNKCAGSIVALCFIGLGFCIVMLLLFRYFVAAVVWVILVGSIVGVFVLAGALWVLYSNTTGDRNGVMYLAIIFTALAIILTIVLICMIKRIKLVIRLFKEAIKVIFGIPLILLEPLLTFAAFIVLLIICVVFLLVWSTAGTLQQVTYDLYTYEPNGAVLFTIFYHCVICLWMAQFILGCQHMVISGAVSAYYFARDKSAVVSPIYYSFYNLVKYHLGTVALGSLILTIVALVKALIRGLASNRYAKIFVECCLNMIEEFLQYLSKNAYIQTAMHGQPFYKSGKRAVRLLFANAINTIAINSVGDFVLVMAKLLIVVCTVGVGLLMFDHSIPYFGLGIFIAACVTALIADCVFAVFETAVDTIFLCFCEDRCMNDGVDRPYYMSTNLMQYIEDAKKQMKDKNNPN